MGLVAQRGPHIRARFPPPLRFLGRALGAAQLAIVLTLAAATAAAAQDPMLFYGKIVATVRVEIEGRPAPMGDFQSLVEVRAGQPLRGEDVRATLARLSLLPGFEPGVEVGATETPGGVLIVFRLNPRHPIDRVEFKGDTGLPLPELERLVLQRYGGVPTAVTMQSIERSVQQILVDRGYPRAGVRAATEETHDPDRATLILTVDAGSLSRIGTLRVTGSPPLDEQTIVDRVGARVGEPFRRRTVLEGLQRLEEELRGRGHYEAVTRPIPLFRDDGITVDLTLEIDAGPVVKLQFTGDDPPGNASELVPIERERSADNDLVQDALRELEAALRNEGYRDARVTVTRSEQPGGVLLITYDIVRGPHYRIARVELPAKLSLPAAAIRDLLEIKDGEVFNEARINAGHNRVLQQYVNGGFYSASVVPAYEVSGENARGERLVVVRPEITEGPRATITEVRFEFPGGTRVPEPELRRVIRSEKGGPYVAAEAAADAFRIEQFYSNLGFRTVTVKADRSISGEGRTVALTYSIVEGPQVIVSGIVVLGNQDVSRDLILEEMTLRTGEPFSAAAEIDSRRRLLALGVFRNVTLIEQGRLPGEAETVLIISVEELPAVTMGYGGGFEASRRPRVTVDGTEDVLEIAPRGFFEISRRNLGGRNRAVSLFSRVGFKPRTQTGALDEDPGFGFVEYRVAVTYNERRAFRTETDLLASLTSEQAVRTSFNFIRRSANLESLRRLTRQLNVYGRYSLDFTRLLDEQIPEDEQPLIDRRFPQVRLSIVSAGAILDRREPSALEPESGTFSTVDVEFAMRRIGSEVGYAKVFGQFSAFRTMRLGRPMVAAARVQLGLARGYERTVPVLDALGRPVIGPDGEPVFDVLADLPASQRFFAGGGNTVRGFQLDRLGVPEVLNANGLSNGGNGLVVLNMEVRTPIRRLFDRELSGVVFLDAGNVFARAGDVDLGRLRGAWGIGGRYDSPLGPVRLDFGFKLDRRIVGGARERGWEYHLSFGQTF